jgi:putative spermidine/putrescine transport system ATP-binding protein
MAQGDAAFVQFDRVQKSYDGQTLVVKDLNLSIPQGEFLTMLGPSGSGKTTCLMMLAGFEQATHGEIRLGGRNINDVPPHKRGIGMVFQNYALFPHMSVAENLAFPLEVRGMSRAEREAKIARAFDMVQMGRFAGRRPAQLSGGQQQRIALARALVFEPELVLMDEPLGALDKQLREHMQFEIKHLHQRLGVTVVYVTHDQTEALTMSDQGRRVQRRGDPAARPARRALRGAPEQLRRPVHRREQHPGGRRTAMDQGRCLVRLDSGDEIDAKPVNVSRVGERTRVSIRPERVEFLRHRLSPDAHTLKARVEEFIYMGDMFRTRVRVAGSEEFIIKSRNAPDQVRLQPGQEIEIGWMPEDCRALDAA